MLDDLANLGLRIVAALTALRGARVATQRSLDSRTRWDEEMSERRLNDLLDQRSRRQLGDRGPAAAEATAWPLPSRWSRGRMPQKAAFSSPPGEVRSRPTAEPAEQATGYPGRLESRRW